ncbi:protein SSUH2 homolog, partial [Montipora foliosa]|uniref:protein SSUH2 homolog n=1 Tax=Montipora foliosa TaxID=591990 RepID=UPI0035F15CE0
MANVPAPSAPPADMFSQYTGYENTRFGSSFVPPPPPYVPPPTAQMPEQHFQHSPAITDDQAPDAMLQFVSEHCSYGKAPAQEMVIKDIVPISAYHYSLTSFCESRKTEWEFEPYQGQPIDSPVNGPAPLLWNLPVQPPQMFADHETEIEVPHTANIKPCHDCKAVGYKQCYKCHGQGLRRCIRCNGTGRVQQMDQNVQCTVCFGGGFK